MTLCGCHKNIYKLRATDPITLTRNLTFQSPAVSLRSTRFNMQKFYMALALRRLFCMDIRTDSDFRFIHH